MMFDQLYSALELDRKQSPWSRELTMDGRIQEMKKEIAELELAIKNKDLENIHEELGDVLWDLFSVIIIAEEKHKLKKDEMIKKTIGKLYRRKPWLLTGKIVTLEEEKKIFQELKTKEKNVK